MSTNANVKSQLEVVERIFNATFSILDKMADKDRMQIKKLAQEVATTVNMKPEVVLGFVNYFAHNNDIAYVTRGKHGGIIKGVMPVKTAKVSKKAKAADTSSDDGSPTQS